MADGLKTFAGRCELMDAAMAAWSASTERTAAVDATVTRLGYARQDVELRLDEVAETCSGEALAAACRRELGHDEPGNGPREVVVLAAGSVPGLSIEAAMPLLACGARVQLRPSRSDDVAQSWAAVAAQAAPELASQLRIVDEPSWDDADAASVHGSDETVELVRERMGRRPVAAYGSRAGIAVLDAGASRAFSAVAPALADDVMTFAQAGCMSPRWLVLPGADAAVVGSTADELEHALVDAARRHLDRELPPADPFAGRRAADTAALSGGRERVVNVGPAEVRVLSVDAGGGLQRWLAAHRSMLQTAVLACADRDTSIEWSELLASSGCTRLCAPGAAQHPPADWMHDGIGRIAPLWRAQ